MNTERRQALHQIQLEIETIQESIEVIITGLEAIGTAEEGYLIGLDSTNQRGSLGWSVEDGIRSIEKATNILATFHIDVYKFLNYLDRAKENIDD